MSLLFRCWLVFYRHFHLLSGKGRMIYPRYTLRRRKSRPFYLDACTFSNFVPGIETASARMLSFRRRQLQLNPQSSKTYSVHASRWAAKSFSWRTTSGLE